MDRPRASERANPAVPTNRAHKAASLGEAAATCATTGTSPPKIGLNSIRQTPAPGPHCSGSSIVPAAFSPPNTKNVAAENHARSPNVQEGEVGAPKSIIITAPATADRNSGRKRFGLPNLSAVKLMPSVTVLSSILASGFQPHNAKRCTIN